MLMLVSSGVPSCFRCGEVFVVYACPVLARMTVVGMPPMVLPAMLPL